MGRTRLVELDLLRFAAVALVLGHHATVCPASTSPPLHAITATWQRGGWIGVDLFFVLSGFLVSGLLFTEHERTGRVRLGKFLVRRGFKIYPAFWVMLLTTAVVGTLLHDPHITARGQLGELLFLQNYTGFVWSHTWSLAVEEHFYLGLALVVGFLVARRPARRPFDAIPLIFLVVAVACLVLRVMTVSVTPTSRDQGVFPTHLRVDSLLFGVLLSYLWHVRGLRNSPQLRRWRFALVAAGIALVTPMFIWPIYARAWIPTYGLTLVYLGCGLLLLGVLNMQLDGSRTVALLAAIGAYSYSIYLWHLAVKQWVVGQLWAHVPTENWFFYSFVYFAGAIVLGVAMARLIEYPVLRFRDRVYPSASTAVERPAPAPAAERAAPSSLAA